MKEDAQRWFRQANEDLKSAQYNFDGRKYKVAAFLCQQSAEKAMKALLIKRTNEFPKIHDLLFLAEKVKLPEDLRNRCKELTLMYVYTRYPDTAKVKDIKNKTQKYLDFANTVLKWAKNQL